MPIVIPMHCRQPGPLQQENIFTMDEGRASTQGRRPLEILIVNLMPTKIMTETQLARMPTNSPLQVKLTLLSMKSHEQTHTSQQHMVSTDFRRSPKHRSDGMIMTGAPIEFYKYEEVDFWNELTEIFDWSKENILSNMYIC